MVHSAFIDGDVLHEYTHDTEIKINKKDTDLYQKYPSCFEIHSLFFMYLRILVRFMKSSNSKKLQ